VVADNSAKPVIMTVHATAHGVDLRAAGGLLFRPIQPSESLTVLADLGRIALYSAYIERLLDRMIWLLVGGDPSAVAPATSNLVGTEKRFERIEKEGAGKPKFALEIAPLLASPRQKAADLWDRRARLIHDPWYLEADGVGLRQFRAMPRKGPQVFEHVRVVPEELTDVIAGLIALWNQLGPIHDRLAELYGP
jgi:hypothetical protein